MSLAAEDRLLLLCARSVPDALQKTSIAALVAEPLDWDYVLASSIRHGVSPLVHRALTEAVPLTDADPVRPAARAELARLATVSSVRNQRLLGVLDELLPAFERHAASVLGLKDLGLALDVYPDPGLRPIGDLDLLVREQDYSAVAAAMAEVGFRALPRENIPYTRRYAWAHHFQRSSDNVWIDVQWNVMQREWDRPGAGRRSFDPELLWCDAHLSALPGGHRKLLVPEPASMLYHLCDHLEGHAYGELILFCDIAEALVAWGHELDWDRVVALARRFESTAGVWHVLSLTERLLGASVPREVLTALDPDVFRAAAYRPIFGGLATMHESLDEIVEAVAPPAPLMRRLESDVRSQATLARALYDQVDELVRRALTTGVELVVLDGQDAGRRFPDPGVPRFGDVRIVICRDDLGLLLSAAGDLGYATLRDGRLERRLEVNPTEPVLTGTTLALTIDLATRFHATTVADAAGRSNRRAALSSLRARLDGAAASAREATAQITLVALDRETVWAWLLARVGARRHGALFAVPPLVDVLRRQRTLPDPPAVAARAAELGLRDDARRGLAAIDGLIESTVLDELCRVLGTPHRPPRLFEWAREGPQSADRNSHMRSAYLYLLCVLAARSGERRRLLRAGVRGRGGGRAALAEALRGVWQEAQQLLRRNRTEVSPPDAYWLEA